MCLNFEKKTHVKINGQSQEKIIILLSLDALNCGDDHIPQCHNHHDTHNVHDRGWLPPWPQCSL